MKILVTGATGFIGRHFVEQALFYQHELTVIVRDSQKVLHFDWADKVKIIEADIEEPELSWSKSIETCDALCHLAWRGLPHYQQSFHLEAVLPAQQQFLQKMLDIGIKQILVAGTCLEYGTRNGMLNESMLTSPETPYAMAKDRLRQWLQSIQQTNPFVLQWCRLFYMYGPGQNPKSLLSQLQAAINNGDVVFNMSAGEQLRDYLPVERVAEYLLKVIERRDCDGVVNICSGEPISVLSLVKQYLKETRSEIRLNLGYYPYPDYEAMAFWGDPTKLKNWLKP